MCSRNHMSSLGLTLKGWSMVGEGSGYKIEEGEDWTGWGISAVGFWILLSGSISLSVPSTGEEMPAPRDRFTCRRSHSKKFIKICLEQLPLHCCVQI